MPFTPFHLGPGAAFKAIGGKHFSFMVWRHLDHRAAHRLAGDLDPAGMHRIAQVENHEDGAGDRERAKEKAGDHREIGRRENAEADEDEEEPEDQQEEELRGNRGAGIFP